TLRRPREAPAFPLTPPGERGQAAEAHGSQPVGLAYTSLSVCLFAVLFLLLPGCRPATSAEQVIVYCAHDREFADDILQQFTQQTGIRTLVSYDTEANKSVGLYEDLLREASRPRCDVHWNNEILATI